MTDPNATTESHYRTRHPPLAEGMTTDELIGALNDLFVKDQRDRHAANKSMHRIITNMDARLENTEDTQARMVQLLEGAFGDEGVVSRLSDLETWRRAIEKMLTEVRTKLTLGAAAIAGAVSLLAALIPHLFSKGN